MRRKSRPRTGPERECCCRLGWGTRACIGTAILLASYALAACTSGDLGSAAPQPTKTLTTPSLTYPDGYSTTPSPITPSPTLTPGPPPSTCLERHGTRTTGPFARADEAMCDLVDADASWRAPKSFTVDKSEEIGLIVGKADDVRRQVESQLPDAQTTSAGTVRVGTDVSATLRVPAGDGAVVPINEIKASTGSDIGLAWTWSVRPSHPGPITLTAHITTFVPNTTMTLTRDLLLTLPVDSTFGYLAQQVATSWQTYAAVITSVLAFWRWVLPHLLRSSEEVPPEGPATSAAERARVAAAKKRGKRRRKQGGPRSTSGT